MKYERVQEAKAEAERFLSRVAALEAACTITTCGSYGYGGGPSPEAAAVKRASMDLTKALAKMRRTS